MNEHVNQNDAIAEPQTANAGNDDSALHIGYLMTGVRARMMQEMDACLIPYGLTGAQFVILRRIAEGVATTAAELCRVLEYDTGSMTRMLDRLEEKCVIIRERSSDDRRVVKIQLTPQGTEQYPKLKHAVSLALNQRFSPLNEEELLQLRGMLERLVKS
ncbi:MAG: MarR family winged helix-turn-helix transcriptional regulator [Steroidobacteraceae bacterium]